MKIKGPYRPRKLVGGKYYYISHLVMEETMGRRLKKNEIVHHKDENPANNNVDNLQIMGDKEHRKFHQRGRVVSEKVKLLHAKLLPSDIPVIRKMITIGKSLKEVGATYKVTRQTIGNIRLNRTWGWIK